jgi:hypothetical protein
VEDFRNLIGELAPKFTASMSEEIQFMCAIEDPATTIKNEEQSRITE